MKTTRQKDLLWRDERPVRVLLENHTDLEIDFEVRIIEEPDGSDKVVVTILGGRTEGRLEGIKVLS